MDSLRSHRSFYAEYIVAMTGSRDESIVNAFTRVDRQRYCGSGPWQVWTTAGYIETPSDDPLFLYHDILIGLLPESTINDGEPSLHAKCLVSVRVGRNERVVHVGVGSPRLSQRRRGQRFRCGSRSWASGRRLCQRGCHWTDGCVVGCFMPALSVRTDLDRRRQGQPILCNRKLPFPTVSNGSDKRRGRLQRSRRAIKCG
jgi:hypothetical protein